ncbi:hypothetical protein ACLQ2R_30770 [Streptosporangium sp. DT93]|uniref:hypothetical protein n=1 Tax=Streptosporangium sp. DT93 TaxID=3393428 RepID=UPI003CF19215
MSGFPAGAGERPGYGQDSPSTAQHARSAVGEVAETAKGQTQAVAGEARQQARQVVHQLKGRVGDQAHQQSQRAAQGIRQWADDLAAMGEGAKPDSPVSGVVQQVADQGRRAADYLDQHGLAGAVEDVQTFARRRPGAFLLGAVAAGFLIGRVAKASGGATSGGPSTTGSGAQPGTSYTPPAYPTGQSAYPTGQSTYETGRSTAYPAATPPVSAEPLSEPLIRPPADPYRTEPTTPREGFGNPGTNPPHTGPGGDVR